MFSFQSKIHSPEVLEHDLNQYFPDLLRFESIDEAKKSTVYKSIESAVNEILSAVVVENFAAVSEPPAVADGLRSESLNAEESDNQHVKPTASADGKYAVSAVAWNIERGRIFEGILEALRNHVQLKEKDVYLLTELDFGMNRSGNRNVAQEIAKDLKLNYAFAPVYIALQKGSGVESEFEGENRESIHGLSMFSKFPLKNVHAVDLPNGKDKMIGKEKRLGYLRALIADIEHPTGDFRAISVHLDAHCSRKHRHLQIKIILDHLETLPHLPTLIGGDWNTTTFNSQNSTRAILGYWRRVMMGPNRIAKKHFPHPDRYFERALFREIESRGFNYKNLNESGAGTLHYELGDMEKNTNLRDWVPEWCFPFLFWAANRAGGKVSARLDWFAGKGIDIVGKPKTIGRLRDKDNVPLSDHDAIGLDFVLK